MCHCRCQARSFLQSFWNRKVSYLFCKQTELEQIFIVIVHLVVEDMRGYLPSLLYIIGNRVIKRWRCISLWMWSMIPTGYSGTTTFRLTFLGSMSDHRSLRRSITACRSTLLMMKLIFYFVGKGRVIWWFMAMRRVLCRFTTVGRRSIL